MSNSRVQNTEEAERLLAVQDYHILGSPAEKDFDDLAELAAFSCKVPIAAISFIEEDGEWFKTKKGLDIQSLHIKEVVIQQRISNGAIYEVADTLRDPFLSKHPLVKGAPNIRFYAGAPLISPDGYTIGTICVMDTVSRSLEGAQKNALKILANQVIALLELRKQKANYRSEIAKTEKIERKRRITKTLSEHEKRYKKLSKFAFEGMIIHSGGQIVDANTTFLRMFGYQTSQVKGRMLSDFILDDIDISSLGSSPEEFTALKKDGTTFYVELMSKPVPYEGDTMTATAIRDITARKAMEQELIQSRIFQKAVFESDRFFVMTTDTTGVIKTFNKGAEKILGYTAGEMVDNVSIASFIGEEGIKERAKALSEEFGCEVKADGFNVAVERARRGLIDENEWTAITKSGENITVSVVGIALKSFDGKLVGFLGIGTDVTEKKKAEQEVIHSRNYFRNVINAIPHPVFVKDREHKCVLLNDACASLMRTTREQVEGKHHHEIFPEPFRSAFYEKDESCFKHPEQRNWKEEASIAFETGDGLKVDFVALYYRTHFASGTGEEFLAVSIIDITERKETEIQLARSEKRFRALVQNSTDFISIINPDGSYRYKSPSFFRATGFTEEDIIGHDCTEFIHPDEKEEAIKEFKEVITVPGGVFTHEMRHKKANGEWMTLEVIGRNAIDDEAVRGLVFNSRDITERKETELKLARGEQRFRALVQNSTDFITILEADGTVRYESPSFYRLSGYVEEDVVGKYCPDFIHPDDVDHTKEMFRNALKVPGSSYYDEFRFRKANGEWLILEVSGKNALDDDAVRGVVVNSRDISERKKAEAEIKEKSKLLQGITSNMPVVIFKVDAEGFFAESMGAGLKKMGLRENEIVGNKIAELYPEMTEQVQNVYAGEAVTAVLASTEENNPWFFEFYAFPDEEGGVIGFGMDISDKQIYEQKQKLYALNLEKVNKELDQFAYVVSHDLKAPLRAINNLSEWIEEDLGDVLNEYEEVRDNMGLMRRRVNRMEALINGILEYSRAGRSEITYERVDVAKLLNEVREAIHVPEGFLVLTSSLPVISANKVRLEQVFSNLLSNAIKYHDKASGKVTVAYTALDGFHEFTVTDDGPGIDPEYHDKIFVIFQTLESKDKTESTGVGLSIVKKIIEEQGGTIAVRSKPGEGATFSFTLPIK